MERFTISLDVELAREFDVLIAARGYQNRSEAVRDLLRQQLEAHILQRDESPHCIASVSYVYNHHEFDLAARLARFHHAHHDLTVSTMHAHLDHEHCIEAAILRGPVAQVRQYAQRLTAERGVRHGALNLIAVEQDGGHVHTGDGAPNNADEHAHRHVHLRPRY